MSYIQTPTPNLESSATFYEKLGFEKVSEDPLVFTDGKAFVEINPERTARIEMRLHDSDAANVIEGLEDNQFVQKDDGDFLLCDPNGIRVRLTPRKTPYEYKEESTGNTGNFAGVSIESFDSSATVQFWESLGFEKTMGDMEGGWAAFAKGATGISVMKSGMCPHLFTNPGLTYFNSGKNLENIAKLEEAGIPITEEITVFNEEGIVDNVIIHDPGGLGFFIFND